MKDHAGVLVDDLKTARHNLRGKLNGLKLCVSAFEILQSRDEELEFLDLICKSADDTVEAMDAFEATLDRHGPAPE